MSSLKVNMALNGFKSIMSLVFPLITFPYVSRVLGVENLGKLNFSQSIVSYFVLIAGLGINAYAIREGSRIRDNVKRIEEFANEIFSMNLIATLFSLTIFLCTLFFVPKLWDYQTLLLILSVQIVFPFMGVEWLYSIYENYFYITIRTLIVQSISLILMFALVKNTSDLCVYAMIVSFAIVGSNIFNFFYARRYCKLKITLSIRWGRHMRPVCVIFATSVAVTVYVSSDITILGILCNDYIVGLYALSSKIYLILKTVLGSILVVSIPRLSAILGYGDKEKFSRVATDIYKNLFTVMLPVIVLMMTMRSEAVIILSGDAYIESVSSIFILAIALLFCMCSWFWSECILIPTKRENTVFYATIISAVVNIVLNIALIPLWKENAAAFTTVIAEAMTMFYVMHTGKKVVHIESMRLFLLKVSIGGLIMAGVPCILSVFNLSFIVYTILAILGSMLVYLAVEIVLKNETVLGMIGSLKNKFFI